MYPIMKSTDQQKVELSEQILKNFLKRISNGKVSELAKDLGLPYELVYNLVHGRINSLSADNYKIIFGNLLKLSGDIKHFQSWRGLFRAGTFDLYKIRWNS